MASSKNMVLYPPNHPIFIGFFLIFTIHFGVALFLEIPILLSFQKKNHSEKGKIHPQQTLLFGVDIYQASFLKLFLVLALEVVATIKKNGGEPFG